MFYYREKHGLQFCKVIISQKIEHQFAILGDRSRFSKFEKDILVATEIQSILLIEARAAREYWRLFGIKISQNNKMLWQGRKPHNKDVANQLLDIGYHYLTQKVKDIFEKLDMPTEIGFLHKAQSKKAHPFVYDFMEWLRPFVVDEVLLKIVAKKKKPVEKVNQKLISCLIIKIKKEFEQKYYHKRLRYCVTLDYWIQLLILSFEKTVNQNKEYKPFFLSLRHESRCEICKIKPLKLELKSG